MQLIIKSLETIIYEYNTLKIVKIYAKGEIQVRLRNVPGSREAIADNNT